MKNLVLLLTGIIFINTARAQVTPVQIDMGAGYINQVFYHFNGTKNTVAVNSWDLGFCVTLMNAGVISNPNNVMVYKVANTDSTAYASIADTAGLTLIAQYNSDTNWYKGAFNVNADVSNPFDFGWGVYDFATHDVYGDTIFIIQKGTDFYKFWIRVKTYTGDYDVRYAKLDGSADVNLTIPAATYSTKNFVFVNLDSPSTLDIEPANTDWQLLFTHYISDVPGLGPYSVTGVLNNLGVKVAEARGVDVGTVSYIDFTNGYTTNMSEIGYDWKYFDMNIFQYVLEDSLIYFVKTPGGSIYSLKFTDFNSADGITSFETEQLLTGINNVQGDIVNAAIFPNPASDQATIVYDAKKNTEVIAILYDVTGKEVVRNEFAASTGLNSKNVKLPKLSSGIYHLVLNAGAQQVSMKVMVAQ